MSWRSAITMCNWNELIDKLQRVDRSISEIFKIDNKGVIPIKEKNALIDHQTANNKILAKLQNREFTVAIVGLENSGKSTLGNALINAVVLPEFRERCTYTTTEIRPGDTDIAEVYFYSREEFIEYFRDMLKTVEYPGYANADFATMTPATFQNYWDGVKRDPNKNSLVEKCDNTTAQDIITILKNKADINESLGQNIANFSKDEWDSAAFRKYITGILDGNANPVRRSAHPYAVKNVTIRSSQLAQMSNIVIYDVPGFNSPTEIHQRQTEEMLKVADAIIFVTSVVNPNFDSSQLKILTSNKIDADGIELREKVFVFGNKIDQVGNLTVANANAVTLQNEAINKYNLSVKERIIIGSARAFFEKQDTVGADDKLVSQDFYTWDIPDGIETLRNKLQAYYDNDRFAVIKQRAKNNLDKIELTLKNLLVIFKQEQSQNPNVPEFMSEHTLKTKDRLDDFIKEAQKINDDYIGDIESKRPFTQIIKDDIEKIYPLVGELSFPQNLIADTEQRTSTDIDRVYPTTKVDSNIRDKLGKIFIKNIVVSASKLTIEKQKDLREKLVDAFLKNMLIERPNPYEDELQKSVNQLFDCLLTQNELSQVDFNCNFNSLVERFTATLTQTLISTPFGRPERITKVTTSLEEFVALAVYYNKYDDNALDANFGFENIGENGINFFTRILIHKDIHGENVSNFTDHNFIFDNKNFLEGLFKDALGKNDEKFPFMKWAKRIANVEINLVDYENRTDAPHLSDRINAIFNGNWINLTHAERVQAIDAAVNDYLKNNGKASFTLVEQLKRIYQNIDSAQMLTDKEKMIEILNADIEILRDITAKAVINAMDLERAFISVVTKNVELIREHLQEGEGQNNFNSWLTENVKKLLLSKFNPQKEKIYEAHMKIITSIESRLDITEKEVMFSGI